MRFIRYAFVCGVWKVIDAICDRQAKAAILPVGVKTHLDVPYLDGHVEGHLLDVYHPEDVSGENPMILYIHGGGGVAGDKRHTRQYCMTLAKEGYTVFNMNYRLAPKNTNPAQISDVMAALAWIRQNCVTYHGDGNKLVLAGDSAGAYLAALAASMCTNPQHAGKLGYSPPFSEKELRGIILLCGLYDLRTASTRRFVAIKSDIELLLGASDIHSYDNLNDYSVVMNLNQKFPPSFISSGEVDGLHPESLELIRVLEEKNVPVHKLLFDKTEKKAYHGYPFHLKISTAQQCLEGAKTFLHEVM